MRAFKRLLITAVLSALPVCAFAQTGFKQVDDFFSVVKGFEADFTQVVYDEKFKKIQDSQGNMALQRPDHFRWNYTKPYLQLIVGDGNEIWIYDKDLDQVTVKPQGKTLGETPAQLLSSSKPIVDQFTVVPQQERAGLQWFELTPLTTDTSFDLLRLGFKGDTLSRMELQDNLGNQTVFEFTNVKVNPKFDKKQFSFTPPEGVDVIGREQQ